MTMYILNNILIYSFFVSAFQLNNIQDFLWNTYSNRIRSERIKNQPETDAKPKHLKSNQSEPGPKFKKNSVNLTRP